jgi:hypothetical protein
MKNLTTVQTLKKIEILFTKQNITKEQHTLLKYVSKWSHL